MSKLLSALSLLLFTGFNTFAQTDTTSSEHVFMSVEQDAEFPGGQEALLKFIQDHIVYPVKARKKNIQGVVIMTFVVGAQGKVRDVKIVRDIGEGCGEEAKRVIESLPRWKPGKQQGQSVSVQYNIPIRFFLKDPAENSKKKKTGS